MRRNTAGAYCPTALTPVPWMRIAGQRLRRLARGARVVRLPRGQAGMGKQHDTGYKELFSHPEFIQQLIESFAPPEIAAMMDFATPKNHSGNYITPLFEEKFEDVVWSVEVHWRGSTARVFLYSRGQSHAGREPGELGEARARGR
jgi:hypothetical protein